MSNTRWVFGGMPFEPLVLYALHAHIPTLDDLARAQHKGKWRTARARAIELRAVQIGGLMVIDPARVMHFYIRAISGFRAGANQGIGLDQGADVFRCGRLFGKHSAGGTSRTCRRHVLRLQTSADEGARADEARKK
jgi:hypothetical protein